MKKKIEEHAALQGLLESGECFTLYDEDLNLISYNEKALEFFESDLKEIKGKNLQLLLPPNGKDQLIAILHEVLKNKEPKTLDYQFESGGRNLMFRLRILPVGSQLAIIGHDLSTVREVLEDMSIFMHISSHDLKSPVSNIIELCKLALKDPFPEGKNQYLELLEDQSKRLSETLDEVMELFKIGSGAVRKEEVYLKSLIMEILKSYTFNKGYEKIDFYIDIDPEMKILSDRILLTSLLKNIIGNAIKYHNEKEPTSFVIINASLKKNKMVIRIEDNGIGIKEEYHEKVFDIFFRATNVASGSGLGLYTCSRIVNKLGGNISLESKDGEGSKFFIELPCNRASEGRV